MELAAPAGNREKLGYAYGYGADAAYIGLKHFSLRLKADNFSPDEYKAVCHLKEAFPGKKLYCALNISFHNTDIDRFVSEINDYHCYPFDAFIVQDLGLVELLKKHFPGAALHLSTQANCVNREAAKLYHRMGFKRIVLGREASLTEIREIKDAAPELELEAFVHGAMCIAYSGRCLMSAYLAGRSANAGHCSHSCRWDYRALTDLPPSGRLYLEEKERPGELLPVFEGENFTEVLSSKDLCMIDHLADMQNAGIDALKIEGRMKSIYYTALVTHAYRKALDALLGIIPQKEAEPFIRDVYQVSHREFTTGFYYDRTKASATASGTPHSDYDLAGTIGTKLNVGRQGWHLYHFTAMNKLKAGTPLEIITPEIACIPLGPEDYRLIHPETGASLEWVSHGHPCQLCTPRELPNPVFGVELLVRMGLPIHPVVFHGKTDFFVPVQIGKIRP
ncbi:MAG: U32 family peptidase [Treponema sp.]|jgi:putative protease|nr:U32 family peptidase [Treponema sp.]